MSETATHDTGPLVILALVLFGLLVMDAAWRWFRVRADRENERITRNHQWNTNRKDRT